MRHICCSILLFFAFGCGSEGTPQAATHRDESAPGHSHERGKMKLVDLGQQHHAGLTAHLSSKTGNELDIFIESADDAHQPTPLPLAKLHAKAIMADGKEHDLVFEPSEPDERKDDPPGKCSHFTAKAPWMKPLEPLTVTADIAIGGQSLTVKWQDFSPKKYAHFEE